MTYHPERIRHGTTNCYRLGCRHPECVLAHRKASVSIGAQKTREAAAATQADRAKRAGRRRGS